MNIKFDRNVGNLALMAAYTWGRSMDDKSAAAAVTGDAAGWAGPMNSHDQRLDYSPSTYDAKQRLVASFVYPLQVGRGQRFLGNTNRAVDLLIGNWQINGIALFQSGFPYSIAALDLDNYNEANGQRADVVGNAYPSGFKRSIYEWFNTAAFAEPPLGVYGNSGRNSLRAPGVNNWDMSLFKNISFAERFHLQLRLESFNSFNHTQFNGPDPNLQDSTFGVVSSTKSARINQIAAKLLW
jgi:hypothetical protein